MQLLSLEQFSAHVNETYTVSLQESELAFVLVEARPLQTRVEPGAMRMPFSLLFLNASPVVLPQQTYKMRHKALGETGIFLVPVARNRDGFLYQAIFN